MAEAPEYLFSPINKTTPSVPYRGSSITTREFMRLAHADQMAWDVKCQAIEDEAKRKKAAI